MRTIKLTKQTGTLYEYLIREGDKAFIAKIEKVDEEVHLTVWSTYLDEPFGVPLFEERIPDYPFTDEEAMLFTLVGMAVIDMEVSDENG